MAQGNHIGKTQRDAEKQASISLGGFYSVQKANKTNVILLQYLIQLQSLHNRWTGMVLCFFYALLVLALFGVHTVLTLLIRGKKIKYISVCDLAPSIRPIWGDDRIEEIFLKSQKRHSHVADNNNNTEHYEINRIKKEAGRLIVTLKLSLEQHKVNMYWVDNPAHPHIHSKHTKKNRCKWGSEYSLLTYRPAANVKMVA